MQQYVKWETPVSDADNLMMNLCVRDGDLYITLDRSSVTNKQQDIHVKFKKCPAFRSILEKFKTKLWDGLSVSGQPGRTFIIENSPWIAELNSSEPIFSYLNKNICHYVIATDWEVVEILSGSPPIFQIGA